MQIHFDTPEFDAQLLRALSYTYYQGADIGECLTTAAYIKPKDFNSWFEEWNGIAQRVYSLGETALTTGCPISAKQAFLRASNYFRAAMFFLYGAPIDPRLTEAYTMHSRAFERATSLFSSPVIPVKIPFEETHLPGYFYKVDDSSIRRPTMIVSNGYDGTHQEGYFSAGAAALDRGYNVLCFDGPGQGEVLIKQQIPMQYDWEKVITPVVDFLETRDDVLTSQIILFGPSWGGYLAPRAAAFEHRLAALIASPGQFDALQPIKRVLPNIVELLDHDPEGLLTKFMAQVLSNAMMAAKFRAKMWIHGVDSPFELLRIWREYTLKGIASQIRCPTLVMDSENEPLSNGQAKMLYEALSCPKDYILFTAKEGAGEHCEAGASSLAHLRLFDLLKQLSSKEQLK
ncbi:MAG: alpha/beta hydrolase [Parachlamydiaceae bacterium]